MTLMERLHQPGRSGPVIGGHRGHRSGTRENTVANFRELLGLDVPYIEIDVQRTADGHLVIFHDPRLEPATPLTGPVSSHTLAVLRQSFEINTAEEVLRWARGAGMGIAFELKFYPHISGEERRAIVRELAVLIEAFEYHENCFVFGKDIEVLRYLRRLDGKLPLALIAPGDFEQAIPVMRELGAFLYLDFLTGLDEEKVLRLHEAGFLVDGSVADTPEALARARALGVDMLESNCPELLLALPEEG